jgi:hypothetical protein
MPLAPAGVWTLRYRQSSLKPPAPYMAFSVWRHAGGWAVALKMELLYTAVCGATNRRSSTAVMSNHSDNYSLSSTYEELRMEVQGTDLGQRKSTLQALPARRWE